MLQFQSVVCFIALLIFQRIPFLRRNPCLLSLNLKNPTKRMSSPASSSGDVVGQMRGGLTFLKTRKRQEMVEFYTSKIGMSIWLEQPNITILGFGNILLGFNQLPEEQAAGEPDVSGMYTFVYPSKEEVDQMYTAFQDSTADGPPRVNARYQIYQFFAKDPEGRALEFQAFLHPIAVVTSKVEN